jgi:predicted DNA-binding helix-hairpin-helix protein
MHLKIMPGADQDQVQQTMAVANRVSVNLEAPNTHRLGMLAPKKIFLEELLRPLKWIEQIRREKPARQNWNGRWASSTTQFVVGAVGESDLELLYTTENLFTQFKLSRVYYMSFNPIIDTPLEDTPPEDPWRQHRLYQASYLLRDYGFGLEELPFNDNGKLPLADDPKLAWAQGNLREMPVELNKAGREMLMKVPGIGHKGANALMAARRQGRIRDLRDLKAVGLNPMRPAPFVLLDGRRPTYQLPLF